MNAACIQTRAGAGCDPALAHIAPRSLLWPWALLLAICNLPAVAPWLCFWPDAVAHGQWWRVLTHPFVHVSWYHLLLDGAAFLLLYHALGETKRWRRLGYVIAAGAGSLLAALWCWPDIGSTGLCGLSGVGHGLMAALAVEMLRRQDRLGWVCLAAVVAKAMWEAITGDVFFASLHFGLVGTPVAVCHAGGVLGALLACCLPRQAA